MSKTQSSGYRSLYISLMSSGVRMYFFSIEVVEPARMTYLVLIEWRVTWWRGSLPLSVKRTETPAVALIFIPA